MSYLFNVTYGCLYCAHCLIIPDKRINETAELWCMKKDKDVIPYDICDDFEDNTKGNEYEQILQSKQGSVSEGLSKYI